MERGAASKTEEIEEEIKVDFIAVGRRAAGNTNVRHSRFGGPDHDRLL